MSDYEHSPRILEDARLLKTFQRNGHQVMLNMNADAETLSTSHYYGMVNAVNTEVPDPYVHIYADKLVIVYQSQAHLDRDVLFETLRSSREAVLESPGMSDEFNSDMELLDAIEKELGIVHESQTIELNGRGQRLAISGIGMIIGLGRPEL